ncbi:hypothetical protein RhiirA4_460852 [Rhizophagus irregularis]|uniref:Uncharacterized protein n=1 Tax=Rhizophagus irregularis TaxID=588596 RepID=A0A2I1GHH6_9GLOM|nr:hypothetical protein RhiirA4_460852 [Rhizophagus irregularis]
MVLNSVFQGPVSAFEFGFRFLGLDILVWPSVLGFWIYGIRLSVLGFGYMGFSFWLLDVEYIICFGFRFLGVSAFGSWALNIRVLTFGSWALDMWVSTFGWALDIWIFLWTSIEWVSLSWWMMGSRRWMWTMVDDG